MKPKNLKTGLIKKINKYFEKAGLPFNPKDFEKESLKDLNLLVKKFKKLDQYHCIALDNDH